MPALSEKDKLDRLAAELDADDDGLESGASVDQNDIDALLAEFQKSAAPPAVPSPPAAEKPNTDGPADGPIGQDDIDRLLAGAQIDDEADAPPAAPANRAAPEETPAEEDLSDQEKMDRLIAELQEESLKEAAEPEEETPDDMTPEDIVPPFAPEPASAPASENPPSEDFDALDEDEMDLDGYEDQAIETDPPAAAESPEAPAPDAPIDDVDEDDQKSFVETPPLDDPPPMPPPTPEEAELETRLAQRQARRRAVALQEKKTARRWPKWVMGAFVLAAAAIGGAAGYRYVDTFLRPVDSAAVDSTGAAPATVTTPAAAADPSPNDAPQDPQPLKDGLESRFSQIDAVRQTMLDKQNEILQLRRDYEEGIRIIEAAVVREAQVRDIKRYQEAAAVEAIDYGLRTIQRRLVYIKRLETPVQRLYDSSEALLYAKRMASANLMLVGLAEGIDSALIGQQMDAALAANPVEASLQLSQETTKPNVSLETIWQRISARMVSAGSAAAGAPVPAASVAAAGTSADDVRIWDALCEGDFSDKYQLTALSPEAGGCLAGWQGTELFLNRLSQLNVREADALSAWKGQWLALNRIESLSAAAVQALFQWKGTRLSLNGLRQLPDGAAEAVANWPGKELELMGLEHLTRPLAKALAHWKTGGGRLFIQDKFYRKQ